MSPSPCAAGATRSTSTASRPNSNPLPAILQFHHACNALGVRLIVVPIPDKAMLQPGQLGRAAAFDQPRPPPNNRDYSQLLYGLRLAGVDVFDPTPASIAPADVRFLAQDTHWTPQWMTTVAKDLAGHVEVVGELSPAAVEYQVEPMSVSRLGDLVDMLRLPGRQRAFTPQQVGIEQVTHGDRLPWRPRTDAQVLLLGDSFTNIYSVAAMGWGESAGFAEQLSRFLRRPVDRISRNDDGAYTTREMLANELAKGRDRLTGKKVVIWQFAMRELTSGDWRPIEMKLGEPRPSRFIVPEPGQEMTVTATVADAAPAPRPGTVAYKDHIVAVHVVDVETATGPVEGGEALAYLWSMRDNVWTDAARYHPGQRVTLRLKRWADVSADLDAINRTELDDERLTLEEPCWAEVVQ